MCCINPPLNYMGSKYKLLPQIAPLMDDNKRTFFDMFTGGGSVAMNIGLNYDKVHMNDLLSSGIHQELHNKGDEFIMQMKAHLVDKEDKEGYLNLRTSYNTNPTPAKLWALILSCNSNMMRFNKKGEFNQTFGKRTFNKSTETKLEDYMRRLQKMSKKGIKIKYSSVDYKNLTEVFNTEEIMLYLDPPYYNTEAGYNVFWSKEDEFILRDLCLHAKCSIAVSGVLFDNKENSPLLTGLLNSSWIRHDLDMNYGKIRKNMKSNYQEVLLTNY